MTDETKEERARRLAEALRVNLRRRKAQSRAREAGQGADGDTGTLPDA